MTEVLATWRVVDEDDDEVWLLVQLTVTVKAGLLQTLRAQCGTWWGFVQDGISERTTSWGY